MKLQIDNLDGLGPRDYTSALDAFRRPHMTRLSNQPDELRFSLVANSTDFIVPRLGSRVTLGRTNGQDAFTGYLKQAPTFEYLGWGEQGPIYRYNLVAQSDEVLLNEKRLPDRCPFVERSAGSALRQLAANLLPGVFDTSAVQDLDTLATYVSSPQKTWSRQAAEISLQTRAGYSVRDGCLRLSPIGANVYALHETDPEFRPEGLTLVPAGPVINDVTVIGEMEPQAYVTDYFVGDGLTTKFYLSQAPFTKTNTTLLDEEYVTSPLEPTYWTVTDPKNAISVSGGKLRVAGGTGADGATTIVFAEKIELGGATVLQHGDVTFNGPSSAVIGGLYPNMISIAGCLAGFAITPSGAQSNIQALIDGVPAGAVIATISGHHYVLTTRLYSQAIYRRQQIFHSSLHPAGNGIGGEEMTGDVRIVLEVHDIDPSNPASQVAPSTVLYDGTVENACDFCTYATVNAANLQCSVTFTRLIRAVDAEVRTAMPGEGYVTRLVGPLSQGSECNISSSAELSFYSAYVPAANQQIVVQYRSEGRALARVTSPASIAAQKLGYDDGCHGAVRNVKEPPARTAMDCENAALALLDDLTSPAWAGTYETWSDFLPGSAGDIFPGDALALDIPSRSATFQAVVRKVEVDVRDVAGEHSVYRLTFANDAAEPLAFEFQTSLLASSLEVTEIANAQVGQLYLADLTAASITEATSTTISIDTGTAPLPSGGFEARWSDGGWGMGNDSNLVGRFATQSFTIPRLSRTQTCYLRQYDASAPPRYSRFSAALHVDYPL